MRDVGFRSLTEILERELGPRAAAVISAVKLELAGTRVSIPPVDRPTITDAELRAKLTAHGWNVPETARALGLSASTIYRRLQRKPEPTSAYALNQAKALKEHLSRRDPCQLPGTGRTVR